ncbi:MAG: hypothetical protein H8E34_04180 [Bacteroidetes bacterium]|nr:hypothetical protein [Bacteroidota bacterium]MBL6943233.1 hypothetical protein [Bacteroidales bacterium]
MKKTLLIFALFVGIITIGFSQQTYSPYFKVADFDTGIADVTTKVKDAIKAGGFDVIGEYHPGENDNLYVICFTNKMLSDLSLEFNDRGALASVLKAGIIKKDGITTLSIINPEYMFLAYWGNQLDGHEAQLTKMSEEAKAVFSTIGKLTPFGGTLEKEELVDYHYKIMMPYFTDPDDLEDYSSFEEGLKIIRTNLSEGKGNTVKVYEQVFVDKKVAVFGVGLLNKEEGEAHFLPIVGEDHIANLPYEIILQGTEATMLAGKYRIALYWPELTMGTFMKIMSTPGEIEDTMEGLCEKD